MMTSHDLAKREKQKLELLRSLLNYFHHASRETRPDVLRAEIDRVNRAAEEAAGRLRTKQVDPASLQTRRATKSAAHAAPEDREQVEEATELLDFPWIEEGVAAGQGHRMAPRAVPNPNWANRR